MRYVSRSSVSIGVAISICLTSMPARAWTFAEGYSSAATNSSAQLAYRTFTIYTLRDACTESPQPASISARLATTPFRVGQRVHRSVMSELVIEAYDAVGRFLPSVPIIVDVFAADEVIASRSDWDYLEAGAPGQAQLRVTWACERSRPIEVSVAIDVSE